MIQFNLLPDVKLEYIRARRAQRLVFGISAITVAVSLGILILILSVGALQKAHLHDLNDDITDETSELKRKPQIGKILTVQNQLESLGKLHDDKPAVTRLFDYLNQVTPVEASITNLAIDYTTQTTTVTGTADALSSVNKYIDTLKFTTYKIGQDTSAKPAFTDVVLTAFALGETAKPGEPSKKATFSLSFIYDVTIFDITQNIALTVPAQVTTRSELEKPTDLFANPPPTPSSGGGR